MAHLSISPKVDAVMAEVEASLLGIVERLAPWIAAIPNAVFVARATSKLFDIPEPTALLIAAGLEVAAHKVAGGWLDAKSWNARKRKTDERAPAGRWFGYLVAIFALDILMVAALAIPNYLDTGDLRQLFVLTYPMIGVVTTIALGESVEQHKRELRAETASAERRQKRQEARQRTATETATRQHVAKRTAKRQSSGNGNGNTATGGKLLDYARQLLVDDPEMTGAALAEMCGRSPRWGRLRKSEILPEIAGNGNGK